MHNDSLMNTMDGVTTSHSSIPRFREAAHRVIDDICARTDRLNGSNPGPLKSDVEPGYLLRALLDQAPQQGEPIAHLQNDFDRLVAPGLVDWQHPTFFGYVRNNDSSSCFPQVLTMLWKFACAANFESTLAELYTSSMPNPGFNWICSPASTELEMKMLDWIASLLGLDDAFFHANGQGGGVLNGNPGEGCLSAAVAARDRALALKASSGKAEGPRSLVMYGSSQTHSIGERTARILDLTWRSLPVTKSDHFALRGAVLKAALEEDLANGHIPFFVLGTVGTTNTGAIDAIDELGAIIRDYPTITFFVDAAWAGPALACPEHRDRLHLGAINHYADALAINFHKWGQTQMDCSALFVRHKKTLTDALSITPAYLRTDIGESGAVVDFRDWQLFLGRSFRSLKIWFVLRSFVIEGFQRRIRKDIQLATAFASRIEDTYGFELCVTRSLALCVFRMSDAKLSDGQLNVLTERLARRLGERNDLFMTPTVIPGRIHCIRMACGNPTGRLVHVEAIWRAVQEEALAVKQEYMRSET